MSAEYTTIQYEVDGHVALVTLNRPDRMNSFNLKMTQEMADLWSRVRDDDEVRSVVLRSAGDRAFCTGLDIKEGPWWTERSFWVQDDPGASLGPKQQQVWKPVVAAVQGVAAGGAMYFLNEVDIVICSEDATFFDPHANGGLTSALEPAGMVRRGIPYADVMRWALLGSDERITAETALRLGIVTEVVPRAELWERAYELAAEIARRRPEAIQATVRAVWESLDQPSWSAQHTGLAFTRIGNRGDGMPEPGDGVKRKPRFR